MKAAIVSKNKGILKELREITKDGLGESGDNSFLIDMAVSFFELNNDDMAIKSTEILINLLIAPEKIQPWKPRT